jgi:hypothetical protein
MCVAGLFWKQLSLAARNLSVLAVADAHVWIFSEFSGSE